MYKDKPYGLYKFGYVEDLEKINAKDLYEYYKELISNCKIDIFISGIVDESVENLVFSNEIIKNLNARKANYIKPEIQNKEKVEKENVVIDSMEVTQGKLILGLDVDIDNEEQKYDVLIYNSILGGTANSKMFQNVREKAHLAYVASSSYLRYKDNIFVNCGIEIENYEKALKLIREQIEDMKNGKYSDKEIENAKKGIIATIKTIDDEQDTGISYCFGQELTSQNVSIEEYIEKIENVTRDAIQKVADNIQINTIYFLKN